ncbi:MAG: hypothetical protein ABUK11_02065 [Mariprofundaceae bacterium]
MATTTTGVKTGMKTPLIIHDLQGSQMFSLAQAAGRAGIPVEGTSWPMEGWAKKSRYIQRAVKLQCLSEQLKGTYALGLKNTELSGVWLPCVDDIASFTSHYQGLLRKMGMRFITADVEAMEASFLTEKLPETSTLKIAPGEIVRIGDLYENAEKYLFPLMIKSERDRFQKFADPAALRHFLKSQDVEKHPDERERVQQFIEGDIDKMASALILFDDDSRPVRGFTCRRLRVAESEFGPFGETTAAKAEWIPELYEGACEMLSAIKWKGFAEVECKQGVDGQWYIMEMNPRLSGWSVLAEADGAGMLSAYYQMCAEGAKLEEACLQRSRAEYVRMIATCYHEPDWAVERNGNRTFLSHLRQLFMIIRDYRKKRPDMILGAWDDLDLPASLSIFYKTLQNVWKRKRIKREYP